MLYRTDYIQVQLFKLIMTFTSAVQQQLWHFLTLYMCRVKRAKRKAVAPASRRRNQQGPGKHELVRHREEKMLGKTMMRR